MFQNACQTVRQSTYGLVARTRTKKGEGTRTQYTNGSAFMISPRILVTSAHLTHPRGKSDEPYQEFLLIRAPEVGSPAPFENARLIAKDYVKDIALLEIDNPRSSLSVSLEENIIHRGTNCGSLGFPLAQVRFKGKKMSYIARERFLGGYVSNYTRITSPPAQAAFRYETDYVMYGGSSGCPAFLKNSNIFGLQAGTVSLPKKQTRTTESGRIAISRLVSSLDIIEYANSNGINISHLTERSG